MKKLLKIIFCVTCFMSLSVTIYSQSWSPGTSKLYANPTSTKVGIGTTSPVGPLHVQGSLSGPTNIENRTVIYGYNTSTETTYKNPIGILGKVSSEGGIAIYGQNLNSNGYGGYFEGKGYFSGNVGIGTTSPGYLLHVKGDVFSDGGWVRVSGQNGLTFSSYGGGFYMTDETWIRTYNNKSFYHNSGTMRTDGTFQVGPGGDRFIVNSSGKVGIGNTSPTSTLHVQGNLSGPSNPENRASVYGYNTSTETTYRNPVGLLGKVNADAGIAVYGQNMNSNGYGGYFEGKGYFSGNVGIGTTTPAYLLDVAGDVNANGGWVRVSGQKGLLFSTYGGGFYMIDETWIRTYNNKNFYHNSGIMRTDGTFQVGSNGERFIVNTSGKVGIGITSPSSAFQVQSSLAGPTNVENRAAIFGYNNSNETTYKNPIGLLGKVDGEQGVAVYGQNLNAGGYGGYFEGKGYFSGNVGIGITTPSAKLQVAGTIHSTTGGIILPDGYVITGQSDLTAGAIVWKSCTGGVYYNNKVGIGTTNLSATLNVNGSIRAEKIDVIGEVPASDYVFEPDYKLMQISNLHEFIKVNKHLPEVPSAEEFKKNGYSVGAMDDLLLRKIEELTLYLIEQNKLIEELQNKLEQKETK